MLKKGHIFLFLQLRSWIKFVFDSALYDTARSQFLYYCKIRISQRKRNQIRKYFNPLVTGQWPRLVRMMKKTHGRKSRWTFPLRGGNYIFGGTTFFCVLSLGILFLSIILLPSISYKCLTNLTSIRHKLQASDTSYKLLTYLTSYKLLTYLTSI